ncbi:hypothetical protein EK21DRAFT_61887 [Setomelanomma holmii]|uniref:HMG box domain-containing protein n=1 Tax=Setomelanomma holmii TaxID=210430 RepID=A0A9P4HC94_9PLEO|nr:hypothetical protein EK21DRAFT_61887 [Setomelanomma holmii]
MLTHGTLCRLGIPKTCARDLPQLARFRQRTLLADNASNQPAFRALSHAYNSAVKARRSYATARNATKPTAPVKKAVKKAATKALAKTKATTKTTRKPATKATTSRAKPKAKTAKKTAPKKPAPRKRVKKVLTPEDKQKALVRDLRKTALKEPHSNGAISAYNAFVQETVAGKGHGDSTAPARLTEASKRFKNLTPAELEHYNHLASEKTVVRRAEYRAWIQSHTPQQIHDANNARARLRKLLKSSAGKRRYPIHTQKLEDDRQPKRLRSSFTVFFTERHASGDLKGIKVTEATKLIAEEWKALSEGEKKKYQDQQDVDKARYEREKAAAF